MDAYNLIVRDNNDIAIAVMVVIWVASYIAACRYLMSPEWALILWMFPGTIIVALFVLMPYIFIPMVLAASLLLFAGKKAGGNG